MPELDENSAKAFQTRTGIEIDVWDVDTQSEHKLGISKWYTDFYSIDSYWSKEFIERRELKVNDKIKFGVDQLYSRFCVCVIRGNQELDDLTEVNEAVIRFFRRE